MNGDSIMAQLQTALAAVFPAMLVTRDAQDYANRPDAQMTAGVVTLLPLVLNDLKAPRTYSDYAGKLSGVILAEFKLDEKSTGLQIEQQEWAIWESLKSFFKAPGYGLCPIDPIRALMSGQRDNPYGWIAVEFIYAELD